MRLFPRTPISLMALAPLVLASAVAVAGPAAGATAASTAACSAWNGAPPVNPNSNSLMGGIAVVSLCDVWAVGSTLPPDGSGNHALIEHWTGSSWTTVPAPVTGSSALENISAVSASDIWAIGSTSSGPLVLHYDGTGWAQKDLPPGIGNATLWDVEGQSANDAWIAGWTGDNPHRQSLMLHWDGTNWTTSNLPAADSGDDSELVSVSADSATDAWAVARIAPAFTNALLHWDGSQWVSASVTGPQGTILNAVTALSPASAWAVGSTSGSPAQTVTERWDGTAWTVIPSPDPGGTGLGNELEDVTGTSGSDVWATGSYFTSPTDVAFALHWNGSSWAPVALPSGGIQSTDANHESVSTAVSGQAWVAGWGGFHSGAGFIPYAVPVPVVPGVTGQQASTASAAVTAAGLTSTQAPSTSCSPSSFGQVISQTPASGTQAAFGQAVTLTVCAAKVTVPDVTGEGDASARSDLASAGLHVGTLTLKVSCTIPRGTVLSQSPAGGASVVFGSSVNLTEATRSGSVSGQATPHFCTA